MALFGAYEQAASLESVRALSLAASLGKRKAELLDFHQVAGQYKGPLLVDGNLVVSALESWGQRSPTASPRLRLQGS